MARTPVARTSRARTPRRGGALLRLLAATVLLPVAVLLLGLWEQERGAAEQAELEAARLPLARVVAGLEARAPRDGRFDMGMQFRRNGQVYVGPLALAQAHEALDDLDTLRMVARARRALPPVVAWAAGLAAGMAALTLLAGAVLGRLGRVSRDALVGGFSLVRRALPALLAVQVLLAAAAFVAAVSFEAAALFQPGQVSSGEIKLLLLAAGLVLGSLWVAGSTVLQLRRTLAAFEPDPLPVMGRTVSPVEAPGLWRLLDAVAERLGALRPDNVVVGLMEGFFVSSGPKVLEPGGGTLTGRTLYLPLPYLPLMRPDEVLSVIGHELAHFSGRDTEYSLRFLPIYAGVGRSLDVVTAGHGSASLLLGPALRLGTFVMDEFHHAVRHWSRRREFAADAAGAGLTSPEAAARALLRSAALHPRIVETLDAAAEAPDAAPPDLVAAVLARAVAQGLDDPAAPLAEEHHPTDTHPPTRQRVAALDLPLGPELMAAAAAAPSSGALAQLGAYFAAPAELCRAVSADFVAVVRRNAAAFHDRLEAAVAQVGTEERVLHEGTRNGAIVLVGVGGVLALAALGLAAFDLPGLGSTEERILIAAALVAGAALAGTGLVMLRRGERPFLTLRPDALVILGLDRAIPWDDVADLDMTLHSNRMVTRLLVPPDAPFPERGRGGRRVKLDARQRVVTVTATLPRGMKAQHFADLIARYRNAARARRLLAEERAGAARAG